jgi:hypothetical protein
MASWSLSASGMHLTNARATAHVRRQQAVAHIRMFCASKRHQHMKLS